ncbi:hypothetical protein RCL2_000343800 [Rhizophagus clarus]|uniref:Iminophenyl-pyruvate dimer synthase domain-containing protein n=1 Tax=Rhizophagus clarus TaxID=94130 RepID=A0A8H3KZM2_9GLOM|nr:hypothetical protein RCL2_000343800 [Rhizophagus clarus]
MSKLNRLKKFAIFPALNVARVGNATKDDGDDYYYVGSEIPGVYVGKGDPNFSFKVNDKLKPQAARYRIYGYDENDNNLGEINLKDEGWKDKDINLKIEWTVVLANRKAAHQYFDGMYGDHKSIRNADWPHNRTTLEAVSEQTLTSDEIGSEQNFKEFKGRVYRSNIQDNDPSDGHELELGKMIIEEEGSLLIIGGKGNTGSFKDGALITQYANNDYWYDDTSDGSVDVKVTISGKKPEDQPKNRESKSWVLVAPPKYAPGIPHIISLYQTILETQHPVGSRDQIPVIDPVIPDAKRTQVEYYRDIYPIFETICKTSWVNDMGRLGHGPDTPGNFLSPDLEDQLKVPLPKNKDLRKNILSRVRVPYKDASSFERNGQAYGYFMPPLSGNGGDVKPGVPNRYITITPGQYSLLQKWADGDFIEGEKPNDFGYVYKSKSSSRQPEYSFEGVTHSFEDVFRIIYPNDPSLQVSQQVKFLNKAALEWCVGGPFFPGIEMTYLAYDKNTFHVYDFRINSDMFRPGDINAYMALPWQADFNECNTHWWPAQRPDVTISEVEDIKEIAKMKTQFARLEIVDQVAVKEEIMNKMNEMVKMKNINWQDMEVIKKDMEIIINDPEQKPEVIEKLKKMDEMIKEMGQMSFVPWTRGFRLQEEVRGANKWGDMDMVNLWSRLGFIIEKKIPDDTSAFVEVQRGEIFERDSQDIKPGDYTVDNLHMLLIIALQIELSTIPPYLYAMYSIKSKADVDETFDINDINDVIRRHIRKVAAEEMLHASLVANLIAAIGKKPVFYCPKMIPSYPNPLPHFKQGLLMVHLSKADEKTFDTFISIEEPYTPAPKTPPGAPPKTPRFPLPLPIPNPSPDFPINVESIGELYQLIKEFFRKLYDESTKFDTKFQLEPGMGYAPSTSTGNDGLIVVSNLEEANRAIDLIIDQGEGKPYQAEMTINGKIAGVISGATSIEDNITKFEGMFEGSVSGSVTKKETKIVDGEEKVIIKTGEIEGKIEKASIQGPVSRDYEIDGTLMEGIIRGVTKFPTDGDQKIAEHTIERIIENGSFKVDIKNIGVGVAFKKKIDVKFENGSIEEYSHYNTFRICKIYVKNASETEYRLWPVFEDPFKSSYIDQKLIDTADAFNAAYSYLMLLLQNAWRTDEQKKEKKELVIGGMPALMHGVLKPIATYLARTPMTNADTNAGATFDYYKFTDESSVKQQLIAAVQKAFEILPDIDELKTAANVVTSLPDISLTI